MCVCMYGFNKAPLIHNGSNRNSELCGVQDREENHTDTLLCIYHAENNYNEGIKLAIHFGLIYLYATYVMRRYVECQVVINKPKTITINFSALIGVQNSLEFCGLVSGDYFSRISMTKPFMDESYAFCSLKFYITI